jgi:hypothetical protein
MAIKTNAYASRVFAEHPIGLWSLDDNVDYVSLITELDRDIELWPTITNATVSEYTGDFPAKVFSTSIANTIATNYATDEEHEVTLISGTVFSTTSLNSNLNTFAISFYANAQSSNIESIKIGYRYDSTDVLTNFQVFGTNEWFLVSDTFTPPSGNKDIKIVIKVKYTSNSGSLIVNGMTAGQWSENFYVTSLGKDLQEFSNINLNDGSILGIEALSYGFNTEPGIYLAKNSGLCARNGGIPLVYGASSSANLLPNDGPSLIVPGQGMLNQLGKNRTLSLEFWIRINGQSNEPKRIVGPISSTDGIYVDGPFLTLKIGHKVASHFVGEWSRPMLLQLIYDVTYASLIINGEEVLVINLEEADKSFPPILDAETELQNDWIGFYAYEDTSPIEVDCVAIYSYRVSAIIAKRRLVYGQAVNFPDKLRGASTEGIMLADYPVANYTKNYNYPSSSANWSQSIFNNLNVTNLTLSSPNYQLPSVVFLENRQTQEWFSANLAIQDSGKAFVKMQPNSDWNETYGYVLFPNMNFLLDNTDGFYGVFGLDEETSEEQVLFKIKNNINLQSFVVSIDGATVNYRVNDSDPIYSETIDISSGPFLVGVNMVPLIQEFSFELSALFTDRSQLSLFVGGDENLNSVFEGKIYNITVENLKTVNKAIADLDSVSVSENSWAILAANTEEAEDIVDGFIDRCGAYSLVPAEHYDNFEFLVNAYSLWEDYVPLSYLSTYVNNLDGTQNYTLDFFQINIDYPKSDFYSGANYDTSSSDLKSYVTFQSLATGANANIESFPDTVLANRNGVISAGSGWMTTKYEFVNGMIVYPPAGVNLNEIAVVIHLESNSKNIRYKPVTIRSLQLASIALDEDRPKKIGTRFGSPLIPYTKIVAYENYKARNPFEIYKGSSPHLYLTENSGVRLRGEYDKYVSRGLSFLVNEGKVSDYKLTAMQLAVRYGEELFPVNPQEVFEIQGDTQYIKFFVQAISADRKRGIIFALNGQTYAPQTAIGFYLNGILVKNPIIELDNWSAIGISFAEKVSFFNFTGAIRITGPMTINSISTYQVDPLEEANRFTIRVWGEVAAETWEFWTAYTWENVLRIYGTGDYGIKPSDIYNAYIGTTSFTVGSGDRLFRLKDYQYSMYQSIRWQTETIQPL